MKLSEIQQLAEHAKEATQLLKELANENRLMIFCCLGSEEYSVTELNEMIPLSQSALSQHLARLREAGYLDTRREGQVIYYRLVDKNVTKIISTLKNIFCS